MQRSNEVTVLNDCAASYDHLQGTMRTVKQIDEWAV